MINQERAGSRFYKYEQGRAVLRFVMNIKSVNTFIHSVVLLFCFNKQLVMFSRGEFCLINYCLPVSVKGDIMSAVYFLTLLTALIRY